MNNDYSEDITKGGVDIVREKVEPHLEGVDLVAISSSKKRQAIFDAVRAEIESGELEIIEFDD